MGTWRQKWRPHDKHRHRPQTLQRSLVKLEAMADRHLQLWLQLQLQLHSASAIYMESKQLSLLPGGCRSCAEGSKRRRRRRCSSLKRKSKANNKYIYTRTEKCLRLGLEGSSAYCLHWDRLRQHRQQVRCTLRTRALADYASRMWMWMCRNTLFLTFISTWISPLNMCW